MTTLDYERFFAVAVLIVGFLAGMWKLITDWRNAPLTREQQLLDIIKSDTAQMTENNALMVEMRAELNLLHDEVNYLKALLRKNGIEVLPMEKRHNDTQPRQGFALYD